MSKGVVNRFLASTVTKKVRKVSNGVILVG